MKEFLQSKKFTTIATLLGLYLVATGISWAAFSFLVKGGPTTKTTGTGRSKIDLSLPKTEACPINGFKFTKAEKNIWDARRPVTAVIENHAESRPPEGLSKADWVYEAMAESGVTRFLAVFYCGVAAEDVKVAPVRSARVHFINWASEYGDKPLYTHVGGANNFCPTCPGGVKLAGTVARDVRALELLETIGWRVPGGNDYDTAYDSGVPVFYRNPERLGHPIATEHTMTMSTDALYADAEKRGLAFRDKKGTAWNSGFTAYKFADDQKASSPTASNISFEWWKNQSDYNVEWKYDAASNQYLRFNGGRAHVDLEYENKQLTAKNIVVMEVNERTGIDSEHHVLVQNIGKGNALFFQNGNVIKGTWSKPDRVSRTKFLDETGREITFVRGVTWVEAIPTGNTVTYK